ncbi:MAG: zinc metallopeptidase [Clostridia bacterium]|nr:zinc metallopeptidase [Clostridia bacterium]
MYFDWTYVILVLPAVVFALWASAHVNTTFKKYKNTRNARGITGADAARAVLKSRGIENVSVYPIQGNLTDHYDPKTNGIALSEDVYNSTSTAAIGIACHEAGHAMQYADQYAPVKIRMAILPVTRIGSQLALPLIIGGFLLTTFGEQWILLAYIGILCFALSALFQLITLPTEFNASRRALACIEENRLLAGDELKGAKRVLSAAAMTYVAALAVSLMQLLRFVLLINGRRR